MQYLLSPLATIFKQVFLILVGRLCQSGGKSSSVGGGIYPYVSMEKVKVVFVEEQVWISSAEEGKQVWLSEAEEGKSMGLYAAGTVYTVES